MNFYYPTVSVGQKSRNSLAVTLAQAPSWAAIKVLAGAAVMLKCDWGNIHVQLTHVAVGRPRVLTGSWLEKSLPCHVGSWLLSEQVSGERARERECTLKKTAFL